MLACCFACVEETGPAGSSGSGGRAGSSGAGGTTSTTGSTSAGGSGSSTTSTTASTGGAAGEAGGGAAGTGGVAGSGGSVDAGFGTDGGTTDSGSKDAPIGSDGSAPDACGAALVCDNFDSYTAPGNPGGMWRVDTLAGGTVSLDTMRAFSGRNSVHVTVPGTASYERAYITLRGTPLFPVARNILFGRMMIYVTRVPTSTVHWSFVQGQGSVVPGIPNATDAVYRYGAQINGNRFLAQYDTVPSSDCAQRSQTTVPMNQWTCVEWRFDGEAKELDFWLNGTLLRDLSVRQMAMPSAGACQNRNFNGIWEPPIFNSLSVGWQHYQTGPGEMWIDDFAFGTQRMGCPAPP